MKSEHFKCRCFPKCAYVENHQDANELGEAERDAEFEGGEGRDESGSALLDDLGNAADVDVPGGEGRGHGGLGQGQRYPGVCCLEGAAVVAPVPAHDDLPPQLLEALNQLDLLIWQHPGKDLAPVDNSLEQLRVHAPDHPEGGAVTREHVVVRGHVLDLAGLGQDARRL